MHTPYRRPSILAFILNLLRLRADNAARFQFGVAPALSASESWTGRSDFRDERDLRVLARVGVFAFDSSSTGTAERPSVDVGLSGDGAVLLGFVGEQSVDLVEGTLLATVLIWTLPFELLRTRSPNIADDRGGGGGFVPVFFDGSG